MNIDVLKEFVSLTKRKREMKTEMSRLEKRIDEISPSVRTELETAGVDSMTVDGMRVNIVQVIACKIDESAGLTREEIARNIKAAGLENYVRYDFNLNTVSSHFREELRKANEANPLFDPRNLSVPAGLTIVEYFEPRATAAN
jgi:hypothetical protein